MGNDGPLLPIQVINLPNLQIVVGELIQRAHGKQNTYQYLAQAVAFKMTPLSAAPFAAGAKPT